VRYKIFTTFARDRKVTSQAIKLRFVLRGSLGFFEAAEVRDRNHFPRAQLTEGSW
jgi:hypothetical protein